MAAYEWSGARQQVTIAPWTLIATDPALDAFAAVLTAHRR